MASLYKIESIYAHAYPKLISLSKIGRITKIQGGGIPTEVKNHPPDLFSRLRTAKVGHVEI